MANEEHLSILKQGVDVWNRWRDQNIEISIDLTGVNLSEMRLEKINFGNARLNSSNLTKASLVDADFYQADLTNATLDSALLPNAYLAGTNLSNVTLRDGNISGAIFWGANLQNVDLSKTLIVNSEFNDCNLDGADFTKAAISGVKFIRTNLSKTKGLDNFTISSPSSLDIDTIRLSKGEIPVEFLRGCGLSDWEIESSKLSNPNLNNTEINKILYKIYDLRASQPIQISPLFISYSHGNSAFVDKLEIYLNKKGIRFWRDIHDMKSGRMEIQVDRAMRLNPTVLLILSEHSLQSDWVEHEVRTARTLEKEMKRDVLCPVALDDSWKNSPWAKRIMEPIMEYNILDFSEWKDDTKFESTFNKLIDGLELFYK